MLHTDAAFGNATRQGTQAGYVIAMVHRQAAQDAQSLWSPLVWRSYRLKRVVSATLAGESQALGDGLGHLEWLACLWGEALDHNFEPNKREGTLQRTPSLAVIDCKSCYDNVMGAGDPAKDKRTAIDLVVVREALARIGTTLRWAPNPRQLADGLTKDESRPIDLLRATLRIGTYQLFDELSHFGNGPAGERAKARPRPSGSSCRSSTRAAAACGQARS